MAFPTGYSKYQTVTIDHTKCGSGNSSGFPAYINLANMVKVGADIFDTCRSDGGDIRATLSDGTTQLPTQLVTIDTTAKTGELWVKIPTLSVSADTVIWIWYNGTDTALARDNTYGSDNVWDSNYKGVFHLSENPAGSAPQIKDSTVNAKNGTTAGSMTSGDSVAVKVGNGLDFDGSDDTVSMGDALDEVFIGASTIEFWANNGQINDKLLGKGVWTSGGGFHILTRGDSKLYAEYTNSNASDYIASRYTTASVVDSTVRHYVITFGGTANSISIYVNGTEASSFAYSSAGTIGTGNTANFEIGASGGVGILGKMDELRISNTSRSTSYITSCYNNQNSPSTFYTVSDEVAPAYAISGTVTLNASPVETATVRCIAQTTNTTVAEQTTDASGNYTFSDLDSAELYHLCVEYETGGTKYSAKSYWDIAPVEV